MQEDIENRAVTLIVSSSKFSGQLLRAAISKYLAHRKDVKIQKGRNTPVTPKGKQSVKQLVGQGQGVSNIEIMDKEIGAFNRIAKRYGVDYAIKKDRRTTTPKYLVFFKSRDADALTAAFEEFTAKKIKTQNRPSVLAKLEQFRELVKAVVSDKIKMKRRELDR